MTRDGDVRELLPFFANGTLDGEDRRTVETAVGSDPALAAEARTMSDLRTVLQRMPEPRSPGEFGLARLRRALDAEERASTAPTSRNVWRLEWVAGIAAVTALFVATATVLFQQQELDYYQASGGATYDPSRVLTVEFDPAVPQAAVTALLSETGLVIVDGPSAIGLYRLTPRDDASLDAYVAWLEAADAVTSVSLP